MPETYAACKRDVNNFFKRIRRARKKAGLPELKYIYTIEGESVVGDEFMEFYPDETSITEVVAELFYNEASI